MDPHQDFGAPPGDDGPVREVACDESGSDGENLTGGNTDVFAHAGVHVPAADAAWPCGRSATGSAPPPPSTRRPICCGRSTGRCWSGSSRRAGRCTARRGCISPRSRTSWWTGWPACCSTTRARRRGCTGRSGKRWARSTGSASCPGRTSCCAPATGPSRGPPCRCSSRRWTSCGGRTPAATPVRRWSGWRRGAGGPRRTGRGCSTARRCVSRSSTRCSRRSSPRPRTGAGRNGGLCGWCTTGRTC